MQLGQNAVQAGQEYVEKTFGGYLFGKSNVKMLFNVSNGYVVRKLGLMLVLRRNRGWNRLSVAAKRMPMVPLVHFHSC